LHGEELYGAQIVDRSEGNLAPGTVYVTLARMIKKGLLTSRKVSPARGGPPRTFYWMSDTGIRVWYAYQGYLEPGSPCLRRTR